MLSYYLCLQKKCLCFVTGFFKNRMLVFTSLTRWTVNFLLGQNQKKKKTLGLLEPMLVPCCIYLKLANVWQICGYYKRSQDESLIMT